MRLRIMADNNWPLSDASVATHQSQSHDRGLRTMVAFLGALAKTAANRLPRRIRIPPSPDYVFPVGLGRRALPRVSAPTSFSSKSNGPNVDIRLWADCC